MQRPVVRPLRRALAGAAALLGVAALASAPARAQTEQQSLVDRATLSVQELLTEQAGADARSLLARAKGALICPRVFKAGFIFGGQGGGCVLVGRGRGQWTDPAFYGMGSGSVGLQIGIQDSQVLFIVLTDRGLQALLDNQFKLGADASLAFATVGVGVQGGTTSALTADIVAFANNRGLFAGLSLEGSIISPRSDWNAAYYGQPIAAQQLVIQDQGRNPGAEPLKEVLTRFSSPVPQPVARSPYVVAPTGAAPPDSAPYAAAQSQGYGAPASQGYQAPYQPPAPAGAPVGRGTIQATPLAPPRR